MTASKNRQTMTRGRDLLIAASVLLACAVVGITAPESAVAADYKGFPEGYCTYYAAIEYDKVSTKKVDWRGDAGAWLTNADRNEFPVETVPAKGRPGAIIVWSGGTFGHVGIVREVRDDSIVIEEMNFGSTWVDRENGITDKFGEVTRATLPLKNLSRGKSLAFTGYILPVGAAPPFDPLQDAKDEVDKKVDETLDEVTNEIERRVEQEAEQAAEGFLDSLCGGAPAMMMGVSLAVGLVLRRKR